MKHLFIINPVTKHMREKVDETVGLIKEIMFAQKITAYQIYISRWPRDAMVFLLEYFQTETDHVRVYSIGGSGTLFEVINGTIGYPNADIAIIPRGECNPYISSFGAGSIEHFQSIENHIDAKTKSFDLVRCGRYYAANFVLVGAEAKSARFGDNLIAKTKLPSNLCYLAGVLMSILDGDNSFKGKYIIDDSKEFEETYSSLHISNGPFYGKAIPLIPNSRQDDGVFEALLSKSPSRLAAIAALQKAFKGDYRSASKHVTYLEARKIAIETDGVEVCMDGEVFVLNNVDVEIEPNKLKITIPDAIGFTGFDNVNAKSGKKGGSRS